MKAEYPNTFFLPLFVIESQWKQNERQPLGRPKRYKEQEAGFPDPIFFLPSCLYTLLNFPKYKITEKQTFLSSHDGCIYYIEDTELNYKYLLNVFPEIHQTSGEYHTIVRHAFINSPTSKVSLVLTMPGSTLSYRQTSQTRL